MKLLIITYSYAPELTPRAFRWSAVAARLAEMGHQVHVLCAAAPGADATPDRDGVTVYRVRDWLLNASARVTPGAGKAAPASAGDVCVSLRGRLRTAIRTLWRAAYWPDFACGWLFPATRVARTLCRNNNYDWIISSSHPFTGHVIGMLTRLRSRASHWLVDISDPYSDMKEPPPNNLRIYARLNRAIEGRVLAAADAISVTTDSTRQLYEASFPASVGKVQVVPPLLSLPSFPSPTEKINDRTLRLVFVGTLYRKLRSPKYLLACVLALRQVLPDRPIEMHFYGTVNDCGDELASCPEAVKSIIFVHGLVSRERVVQAMLDSDVLVNIGNDSEAQLASKVVEYMATGKPILNLVSIDRDTSITALAEYPAKLTIMRRGAAPTQMDIDAMRSFVVNPPPVSPEHSERVREQYSIDNIAGLYESMLVSRMRRSR